MNKKLQELKMKNTIIGKWKEKLGFLLNYKDLKELENIIDYYEHDKQQLEDTLEQKQSNLDNILRKLNYIAFSDDSELALRYLRRIGYVGFDFERKVYINNHNNEPFLLKHEKEKDYYLKDDELDEYTKQLKYKLQQKYEVIEKIKNILIKHRYEENDDYHDVSVQGICITGWDNDYDELLDILNIKENKNEDK